MGIIKAFKSGLTGFIPTSTVKEAIKNMIAEYEAEAGKYKPDRLPYKRAKEKIDVLEKLAEDLGINLD